MVDFVPAGNGIIFHHNGCALGQKGQASGSGGGFSTKLQRRSGDRAYARAELGGESGGYHGADQGTRYNSGRQYLRSGQIHSQFSPL